MDNSVTGTESTLCHHKWHDKCQVADFLPDPGHGGDQLHRPGIAVRGHADDQQGVQYFAGDPGHPAEQLLLELLPDADPRRAAGGSFPAARVIAGATIGWGAFAALGAASTGWITMLLTRLGLGLAEGPIYPAGAKLIGMWMTPTERGRAAALLDGGAPLGTALGSLIIAGLIAALGSWRLAFLAAGLAPWRAARSPGSISATIRTNMIRSVIRTRAHPVTGLRQSAADAGPAASADRDVPAPSIWLLFVGWFCFNSLWYGFLTWVPSFLVKTQGLNIGALGWASFLIFFAGFAGELTGGQLLDYFLRQNRCDRNRVSRAVRLCCRRWRRSRCSLWRLCMTRRS